MAAIPSLPINVGMSTAWYKLICIQNVLKEGSKIFQQSETSALLKAISNINVIYIVRSCKVNEITVVVIVFV